MPRSGAYAAIATRSECPHHLFDQGTSTVAHPKHSRTGWAYQSRIFQNLECNSITIGGVADHVHVLCNLTKKFPTAKVIEILKKDSSKFIKTLGMPDFHWQDGYGLFSVSPSHFEAVRKYVLDQEERHKKETFRDEYLRILKKSGAPYDERYLWD